MRRVRTRRALLALVSSALLLAGVGTVSASSTTVAAGFTIGVDESAIGVTVGAVGVVAVDVSPVGSWVGPVSLTVAGAPRGALISILPNPVLPGVPAIVVIAAGVGTPAGSFTLVITATSGNVSHRVSVLLVVSLPTGFTLGITPPVATVVDGGSVNYAVSIKRGLLAGPIALKVTGLPQYATASVSPSLSLLGNSATVHVSTTTNVVPGVYRFTVKGSALLAADSVSAYLIVQPQTYPDFPISGTADRQLAPAVTGLLNLALTNPFDHALTVTALSVSVTGTDRPGCDASNFAITQYTGGYPLTVPGHATRTLQQLGVVSSAWPAVTMLDLPVNQDACKSATVQLAFTGQGNGN